MGVNVRRLAHVGGILLEDRCPGGGLRGGDRERIGRHGRIREGGGPADETVTRVRRGRGDERLVLGQVTGAVRRHAVHRGRHAAAGRRIDRHYAHVGRILRLARDLESHDVEPGDVAVVARVDVDDRLAALGGTDAADACHVRHVAPRVQRAGATVRAGDGVFRSVDLRRIAVLARGDERE